MHLAIVLELDTGVYFDPGLEAADGVDLFAEIEQFEVFTFEVCWTQQGIIAFVPGIARLGGDGSPGALHNLLIQ